MIRKIDTTSHFRKKFKQLDKKLRLVVAEEIAHFKEFPDDPVLNTHPIKDKFTGFHAFSVLPDLRIMFLYTKADFSEVTFYDIGTHEIYK